MRFNKHVMVAVVTALLGSISATPVEMDSISATPVETDSTSATPVEMDFKQLTERAGKYDPAISFATWTDGRCSSGQVDYQKPDGSCISLPGQSMKIWWLASGCRMLLGDCYNSVNPNWRYVSNECVPIGDKYKYQIYC
ncbi:hypothetical protein DHEL01_v209877 [Diaporthe helianthi]|uniref:Uncharacterized protein n=1 Tax=Diaporthe helianthi TaxID=158607 RepID=A0A2P5HNB6_DIAHE|nr:hypothetical protein DHEL01_v209877 [Diaporthe helianthi]